MPVEARPDDQFTRGNLLLGFSTVEFEPVLPAGGFGPAVEMGILASEALQKDVTLLELERGDAGTLTVDREVISKLKPSFKIESFNLRDDVSRFIFASDVATAVVADAAAAVTGDLVTAPTGTDATRTFLSLTQADIDATTGLSATGAAIVSETVNGSGALNGAVMGDFSLAYKITDDGDVSEIKVVDSAGVETAYTPIDTGSETGVGNEAVLDTGGVAATSGDIRLDVGGTPTDIAASSSLVCSYNPTIVGADDDNSAAVADYIIDPLLGRIMFRRLDTLASPDGASAFREGQPVDVDYLYSRKASTTLQPFRQTSFDGRVTIRHLTDIGINFVWDIPSATIRVTDDDLTFGAEDFGVATLILNINDAGGTQRFGTLALSSEAQAAA
jgi:hypothetical protein